jgi:cAMP-dependent protein kinase regulator
LTLEEKSELERLRLEIRKYRDLDAENTNEDSKSQKSMESDDEETIPDNHAEVQVSKAKVRLSNPRAAVSAEVYGNFNKKEDFNPRVIKKTEEQIHRIKARILQSFLFCNLDQKDLEIVINAMEEKKYEPEQTVIEQGEAGDCLFVVETGELNCFKKFVKILF